MLDLSPTTTLSDLVSGGISGVRDDVPVLDRLIGLTGRDPTWRAHA